MRGKKPNPTFSGTLKTSVHKNVKKIKIKIKQKNHKLKQIKNSFLINDKPKTPNHNFFFTNS